MPNVNKAQTPRIKVAEDRTRPAKSRPHSPVKAAPAPPQQHAPAPVSIIDSGYHGSQTQDMDYYGREMGDHQNKPETLGSVEVTDFASNPTAAVQAEHMSPTQGSMEDTFESAKEEQTRYVTANMTMKPTTTQPTAPLEPITSPAAPQTQSPTRHTRPISPKKLSPVESSPSKSSPGKAIFSPRPQKTVSGTSEDAGGKADGGMDDIRSSDGSSPIRPIVRKSSLNFASLPAREPLTSTKSLGPRASRISHLDQTRTSYYQRHTGGKSLGVNAQLDRDEDDDEDEDEDEDDHDVMDIDDDLTIPKDDVAAHNKTYTQRLQDQISMLGKSQPSGPRPSKSLANVLPAQQPGPVQPAGQSQPRPVEEPVLSPSPKHRQHAVAPGAFPEDDDDDWISPPSPTHQAMPTPRPTVPKHHSADVMEGLHGKETVGGSEFVLPRSRPASPLKGPEIPDRTTSALGHGHAKSASVPYLPYGGEEATPKKGISVSNPSLNTVSEDDVLRTPSKSPSRNLRDSPLKQVKNKLSSILKSSKGLLASSAALSAEGKSLISPSMTRLGFHGGQSTESLRGPEQLYPDLSQHQAGPSRPQTASGSTFRRTRASAEREKREAKEKEKEAKEKDKEIKEAKRLADQMGKLEKAREKEREKARVFSKERERIADMEKQIAEHKDQGKAPQAVETPGPAPRSPPKATRSSPRKAKAQPEAEGRSTAAAPESKTGDGDDDMMDGPSTMGPPQAARSAASSVPRAQGLKRPTKPTKEIPTKTRQAPTVIRVNTTSAQQSQYHHPSNSVLAASLQETLGPQNHGPQRQLASKASHGSLQTKPSLQSLKGSSSGRPKALDLAAKRKEQEERETQRKREAKLEMERKRAAAQEEERRQEQQRRHEMEAQKEEERKQAAAAMKAKKDAQRQAAIERAKQTRAPPPAARPQGNAAPEYSVADKGPSRPPSRPPSRLGSMIPQDGSRPVNAVLSNSSKMGSKRPLQQEANEDGARPPAQRTGPSYQPKDVKRMRMSEEFDDDIDMADSQPHVIKGPPVRPSGGFKKVSAARSRSHVQGPNTWRQELPTKSMFGNGYTPAPQGVSRDLFKSTVTAQHASHAKVAHPLEMAQLSKGAIPFAHNPNGAGAPHKTPARPAGGQGAKSAAKSAAKSSPRFQNGDAIELPEIETDEEDEDESHIGVAAWADSPDLRRALMRQETVDPMQIFGAPAALNMEEVFSKSKDRFHKFRARTSSANWSGSDRLTEEDIRKDLQARDRMRREGGWTYELNRDGLA